MRRFSAFSSKIFTVCASCAFSAGLMLLPAPATAATSMMESVEAAFAYNPELKASQHNRAAAASAVDRARAGFYPSIAGYAGAGVGRLDDSLTYEYEENKSWRGFGDASLRLVQPIWHGGATTADVEGRSAQFDSADMLLEDKGSGIAFDALTAHIEVTRRARLVELASANVAEHAEILSTVRKRYDTHVATVGELNQIESRYARAQATLVSYQASYDAARALYLRITGREALALTAPVAPTLDFANADAVRTACLDGNQRILSARADVRALQADRDMAASRFLPYFDIEAGPSWSDRDSNGPTYKTDVSAQLRVRWDIFNGGSDQATVAMSESRISQARQNLFALTNALTEDINATYSRYESAQAQSVLYREAQRASRAAREDYYKQFLAGQRSLIDVLDAENDFFYAASQQAVVDADRIIAAYRLLALGGRLLPALGLDPTILRAELPVGDRIQ